MDESTSKEGNGQTLPASLFEDAKGGWLNPCADCLPTRVA